MDAGNLARILTIQFRYTDFVFQGNLEGLSEDDGFKQPSPGGNCLNWVAGHIVESRAGTVGILGQELPFAKDKYARYERGSDPVSGSEGTVPLVEMMADFAATREALAAGLAALTDEAVAAKAPFSPGNNPEERVGSLLAGLVFHESYHCGQLGVLRRMAGEPGFVK